MTIEERYEVDMMAEKDGLVKMYIVDHLGWAFEDLHLKMLEVKIQDYLTYLATKEAAEKYPHLERVNIEVFFTKGISQEADRIIRLFNDQLEKQDTNITISYSFSNDAENQSFVEASNDEESYFLSYLKEIEYPVNDLFQ